MTTSVATGKPPRTHQRRGDVIFAGTHPPRGSRDPARARRRRPLPDGRGPTGAQRPREQDGRRVVAGRLHRPAAVRHPARRSHRPARRHPAGTRGRPGDLPLRAATAGEADRLRGRPAGRRAVRRVRPVGHRVPRSAPGAGVLLARGPPGLPPVLRRSRVEHRPHHPHGRPGAGDHGAADHHGDHPRDLRPDAEAAPGGRPGPRRDPLGDDPARGPALREVRDRVRGHARPRPRPRRDHGDRHGPLGEPGRSRST